jgi:trigger factor
VNVNVEVTKLPESKVALKVELTPEEVDGAMTRTYKQLVQRVTIPGFRKGKAPRSVVERLVGEEYFVHEATDEAVQWGYRKALDQTGITPIDQAEIGGHDGHEHGHVEEGQPFHFEATVAVKPEVPLPDYRTITVERVLEPVTDEDVDTLLQELRAAHATLEPTVRPAQVGDTVIMNVTGTVQGKEVINEENAEYEIREPEADQASSLPGLSQHLLGTKSGQIVETAIDLPEGYANEEVAGKPMGLRILIKEIKAKILPELDDDFAAAVGAFETLEDLRMVLRSNLKAEREQEADRKLVQQAIDEVVNRTFTDIPPVLIEEEIDRMVGDMRRMFESSHLSFEDYQTRSGQTEQQFRDQARENATKNVKTTLVLSAVADAEGIDISNREIDAALEEVFRESPTTEKERRRIRSSSTARSNIRSRLRRQRAIRRLVDIVSGADEVADEATEAAEEQVSEPTGAEEETLALEAGG